jgi:PAS domain S-box-containing protein
VSVLLSTPDPRPHPGSKPELTATGAYPAVPDPDALADVGADVSANVGSAPLRARRAAERRLAAVVEGMAEAFLSVDENWRITYANREVCRLNHTTRALLIGRDHWATWPETVGSEVERQYRRVAATGVPARFEHYYPDAGLWHAIQAYPAEGGGLAVFYRDITAEKAAAIEREQLLAAERAARERTARLQALTAALSTASTLDEVAAAVVAQATAAFGAVGMVIARLSPDGRYVELMGAGDMPDDVRDEWRRFPLDAPVPLAEVARTGRPLFLESRAEWGGRYPHLAPLLEATGHHANVVAPLVVDGRVVGALGAAFDTPRTFGGDDRALTLAIAHLCAQALERARLFEAERAARAEAERARVEAEAANRAKSQFLTVMSHELRTPLNAIAGYAELLELGIRGPVTAQQVEDLRRIRMSERHLLGLINEVLNYAKLETGTVRYEVADVLLRDALAAAEALVAPQARAKGLDLALADCPPALAARADGEKLRQIIVNLLSNAVKFTRPGGRVELACAPVAGQVRVVVRDTGIGIPADKLEAIFEPFVQVRADFTRTHEGTGLGLAISRDLARGMGGDLSVESTSGAGSTFTLTLPRA